MPNEGKAKDFESLGKPEGKAQERKPGGKKPGGGDVAKPIAGRSSEAKP